MTITYRLEKLVDAQSEIDALLPQMWAEMADGFDGQVAPNWTLYRYAEQKGAAFLLTAREEGRLVGWFGATVYPNPSKTDELIAEATPYWVEKRTGDRGLILRSLIRHANDILRQKGVRRATVKTHPWASAETLLEAMGARLIEKRYMFNLKQGAQRAAS